jgi:hypothetical protein
MVEQLVANIQYNSIEELLNQFILRKKGGSQWHKAAMRKFEVPS